MGGYRLENSGYILIILSLYFFFKISRRQPWRQMSKNEKTNSQKIWTLSVMVPCAQFTGVINNILFPSSLSLSFIAIGIIITAFIGWYFYTKRISERYVSKSLENGGLLWKSKI
jgi:amino acid transporter